MAESREVRVIVGKRSYRMHTDLDDLTLARVTSIVDEVGLALDKVEQGVDQEHFLMLTCLQLAYNLEKISNILEPLQARADKLMSEQHY